ncbi:MAG TPA: hypothetical protein VD883_02075, partial [Candidatus Omnitrophota bacterium]|nr:hypothetical protein [Candidatus Omnitrophota bacterium]
IMAYILINKKSICALAIALLLAVSFTAGDLWAEMVEEAEAVPQGISGVELKELEEQKGHLDDEFKEITQSTLEYNSLCSGTIGSMNQGGCSGRYYALSGRMSAYNAALVRYRMAIKKASDKSEQTL